MHSTPKKPFYLTSPFRSASLLVAALLAAPLCLMSINCGGGGGSSSGSSSPSSTSTSPPTPVPPTPVPTIARAELTVIWPGRFKAALAPTAAESVTITITRGDTGAVVGQQTLPRPDGSSPDPTTVAFTSLPATTCFVSANAYPTSGGTGNSIAQGSVQLPLTRISNDLTISFTFASNIDHMTAIPSPTRVALSGTTTVTLTAYDVSGNVILIRPETISWVVADPTITILGDNTVLPAPFFPEKGGTTTVTATDSESGKTATATIGVGFPITIAAAASQIRGTVPITSDQFDDGLSFERLTGDTFVFQDYLSPYAQVASLGTAINLSAPATYGDRQFLKWSFNGVDAGTNADDLFVDPNVFSGTNTATAVYQTRAANPDGSYSPNYFGQVDAGYGTVNYPVIWDRSGPVKVAFVTQDGWTAALEAVAIQGFQGWLDATGGVVQFDILPDNDTDDADVVVEFTTPDVPTPNPDVYITGANFALPLTTRTAVTGLTLWIDDPTTHTGLTKRVITLFYQRIANNEVLRATAEHEMGHALGSSGHSNDPRNVMYYSGELLSLQNGTTAVKNPDLWEEDVNMVETLYNQQGVDLTTRSVKAKVKRSVSGKRRMVVMP